MHLLLLSAALAAEPTSGGLPPAPTIPRPERQDEPPPQPAFGNDVSLGYFGGALLGAWPDAGVHGAVVARYDAFVQARDVSGPRLGASVWASSSAWPSQTATEMAPEGSGVVAGGTFPIQYLQYGVMAILRHDPAAPVSGDMGFGFGRLDLPDYYGGPLALPMLSLEAGLRQQLHDRAYLDWLLRGHWATQRSATEPSVLHEWWMVQLGVSVGFHLR